MKTSVGPLPELLQIIRPFLLENGILLGHSWGWDSLGDLYVVVEYHIRGLDGAHKYCGSGKLHICNTVIATDGVEKFDLHHPDSLDRLVGYLHFAHASSIGPQIDKSLGI